MNDGAGIIYQALIGGGGAGPAAAAAGAASGAGVSSGGGGGVSGGAGAGGARLYLTPGVDEVGGMPNWGLWGERNARFAGDVGAFLEGGGPGALNLLASRVCGSVVGWCSSLYQTHGESAWN